MPFRPAEAASLVAFAAFLAALALDDQHAVLYFHFHVFFGDARQIHAHLQLIVLFVHLHVGHPQ